MKTIARLILVAVLLSEAGCAKPDWVQQTLVTADVTGTWAGSMGKAPVITDIRLEAAQDGPKVAGYLRLVRSSPGWTGKSGPVEGTVTGDVFKFESVDGAMTGEVTVSEDQMTGYISTGSPVPISLRRIDSARPSFKQ